MICYSPPFYIPLFHLKSLKKAFIGIFWLKSGAPIILGFAIYTLYLYRIEQLSHPIKNI